MPKTKNILLLLLGCVANLFLSVNAQDVCIKKGPCSCEFSNGTGIDLSPSANTSFFTTKSFQLKNEETQYELSTYYYHPCYDELPKINSSKIETCGVRLSVCRHNKKMDLLPNNTYKIEDTCEFMGSSNVSEFSADGKSILYNNGPSSTTMLLICAVNTADTIQVYSLEEPDRIVLAFYSPSACLRQLDHSHRSFGSNLLIIFFSFVIFYLVLGICTKKFLMGATGVEVVPNLGFWTDLPNLVKDGYAFAINGFKLPVRGPGPMASPDPNSYDSI